MIRVARLLAPMCVVLLGILGILVPVAPVPAQNKPVSAGEGKERLTPEKDWSKSSEGAAVKQFQQMKKGDLPKQDAVLEHAAQWYAYRLTYPEYQDPKPGGREMHTIVRDALDQILDNPKDPGAKKRLNANQTAFVDEFGKRLAGHLHEVVKNPKVIARANAAIVLAKLAGTGQEDAALVLVEVIQDPKESDAVKLHALRGLKELFAWGRGESPFKPGEKEKEAKCVGSLLDYVRHEPALAMNAAPDEVAGIQWVRREAIEALGFTRLPAKSEIVKGKTITQLPTALVLLQVLRKDKEVFKNVEPSLREQVAAAIGIGQLQYKSCEDYQADYAAYQLGQFLVEFAGAYNNKTDDKPEPWKIHAARLSKALAEFTADLVGPPRHASSDYAKNMADQASGILSAIESGAPSAEASKLASWLEQNPAKSTALYKSLPDSVVKTGEKTAE